MSAKFDISSRGLLLLARFCNLSESTLRDRIALEANLKKHASEITAILGNTGQERSGGLSQFARQFDYRNEKTKIYFYQKIITELRKENRSTLSIASDAPPQDHYEKIIKNKGLPEGVARPDLESFCRDYLDGFFENKNGELPGPGSKLRDKPQTIEQRLCDTTWYFYYHEYLSDAPYPTISRVVLNIRDFQNVTLHELEERNDFQGTAITRQGINSSTLRIVLHRELPTQKELELRIILSGKISDDSIFLGQYMGSEQGNEMTSGNFVLLNVKCHKDDDSANAANGFPPRNRIDRGIIIDDSPYRIIQTDLVFSSGWQRFIPDEVAEYLSNKWQNFTKTVPSVSTRSELSLFLKGQARKRSREPKSTIRIDYDFFVIMPVGELGKLYNRDEYKQINRLFFKTPDTVLLGNIKPNTSSQIYESSDNWKMIDVNRLYYSPRVMRLSSPDNPGLIESRTIFERDLSAMRRSRFVLFIARECTCSSALVEVGWALQMGKRVFVVPLTSRALPKILSKTLDDRLIVLDGLKIKDIAGHLRRNYRSVFRQ